MAHSQYLTFGEYVELGGTSSELSSFSLLEFRARKRIDRMTFSRVQEMAVVPEAVKLCMFSLIETDRKVGLEAQVALCGVREAIPRAALSLLLAAALLYVVNKSRR